MPQEEKKITGPEKAAILLLSLGDDTASEVLKRLGKKEIQSIGSYMTFLGNVSSDIIDQVNEDFYKEIASGQGGMIFGGKDYLKKILEKVMDSERVQEIMANLAAPGNEAEGGGLDIVRMLDPQTIANFIKNEHPQTSAIILAHLSPNHAASVISTLENNKLKQEIVMRMATLDSITPDVVRELDEALMSEFKDTTERNKIGGINRVAEILNQLDSATESAIMSEVEGVNPDLANEIRQLMFVFEDLLKVDDRGMQAIMKEVASDELLMSLKTASEELKEKIFKNMSERAAQMAKEDLEAMGPARLKDVEKAQQNILVIAKKLEDEGKIAIGGGGEEFV